MLEVWDVEVSKEEKTMSIHQSELMKKCTHNFQMHAKKMLKEWGIKVPVGGNVMSICQIELVKRDKHNFQVHAEKKTKSGVSRYLLAGSR